MNRLEVIRKLFSKQPKTLYEMALTSLFKYMKSNIDCCLNNPASIFENVENMYFMLKQLQLPKTILIDLFFYYLQDYTVIMSEEGMSSTGRCQDCLHLRYPMHNDYEPIKIYDLYCKICAGELFLQNKYFSGTI